MVCVRAAPEADGPNLTSNSGPEHLIVLANGILSDPNDWNHVESLLLKESGQRFLLYAEKDNVYCNTMRGIDIAGKRLAEGVLEVVKRTPSLQRISFVGHSLGGLFVRFCLALLYRSGREGSAHRTAKAGGTRGGMISEEAPRPAELEGSAAGMGVGDATPVAAEPSGNPGVGGSKLGGATWRPTDEASLPSDSPDEPAPIADAPLVGASLDPQESRLVNEFASKHSGLTSDSRPTIAGLEPAHLILVAVPHLGVWGRLQWPFAHGVHSFERIASCFSGIFLGRTLGQLFLRDRAPTGEPLLLSMSKDCKDRPFVSALGAFRTRYIYANVRYDAALGWKTSCIRLDADLDRVRKACLERAQRKEWLNARYPYIVHIENTPGAEERSAVSSHGAGADFVFAPPLARQLSEAVTVVLSKKGTVALSKEKTAALSKEGSAAMAKQRKHKWSSEEACRVLADRMVLGLHQVSWTKMDVLFQGAPGKKYAHQMLIMKDPVQQAAGQGVVNHILDVLCDRV